MITEIISFDGTTFSPDYEVGFVPGSEPRLPGGDMQTLERIGAWPVIAALARKPHRMAVIVRIMGSDRHALRSALFRLFDPEDETPKTLVGTNHDGVQMYLMAAVEALQVYGDQQHDTGFVATLVIDGDVRWRSVTADDDTWAITASAQTRTVTNDGEDEAYPVLTIEPTAGKTGGYAYRHWVPVVWRSENAGPDYPVMIDFDTATPIAASQMDAAGADLRVRVDGVFVGTTVEDIDDANTKIWFTASWTQAPQLALRTGFLAGDTVVGLDLDDEEEMARLPDAGTVMIGSEAFVYTGRSLIDRQLTGVTRAAKGTTAADHSVADDVHWIQLDIWLMYGNTSPAAAPADFYTPVFDTDASSNTSWVYAGNFGDRFLGPWPGAWENYSPITITAGYGCYTATEIDLDDPWEVIGSYLYWGSGPGAFAQGWKFYNPCGIVNVAYTGGKVWAGDEEDGLFELRYWVRGASWWTDMTNGYWRLADDPLPAAGTWYSQGGAGWLTNFGNANAANWSAANSIAAIRYTTALTAFEFSGATVTLDSDETPVVTVGAQDGNYSLEATITNQTTGEAITISYVMDLNAELEIDTDLRTVTDLADDSGQFQAVTRSTVRRPWLRLLPGDNVLRFDDAGTNGVTLTIEWEARYY